MKKLCAVFSTFFINREASLFIAPGVWEGGSGLGGFVLVSKRRVRHQSGLRLHLRQSVRLLSIFTLRLLAMTKGSVSSGY